MITGKKFYHPHTGAPIEIRQRITCTTTHVVYTIICPCGLTYVGKTQNTIRERMGNHRSALRAAFDKGQMDIPLYKHYLEKGHGPPTFRFMGIDTIPNPRRGGDRCRLLLQKETFWIKKLNTISPRGLNEYCSFVSFLDER